MAYGCLCYVWFTLHNYTLCLSFCSIVRERTFCAPPIMRLAAIYIHLCFVNLYNYIHYHAMSTFMCVWHIQSTYNCHLVTRLLYQASLISRPLNCHGFSSLCGYHVSKDSWMPPNNKELVCAQESGNPYDPYKRKEAWLLEMCPEKFQLFIHCSYRPKQLQG